MAATHICPWWAAYFFDNSLRGIFHRPEKMLGQYVQPGMTVMDLGCGMGYFSIAMARMVGPGGRVVAVDIQEKMLKVLAKRAEAAGVLDRIQLSLSGPGGIGVKEKADFVLAMWMLHEVPDVEEFLRRVRALVKEGGKFLIVEPKAHVSLSEFKEMLSVFNRLGFKKIAEPKVALSRAALFTV